MKFTGLAKLVQPNDVMCHQLRHYGLSLNLYI